MLRHTFCTLHIMLTVVWIVFGDKNSTNGYRYVSPPNCREDVANINAFGRQYVSRKSACAIACTANTPRCVGFNYIKTDSGEDLCEYVDVKSDENSKHLLHSKGSRYYEQLGVSERQVTCSRTPPSAYTYFPIPLSYSAATAYCRDRGAHLATAETREELSILYAIWQQTPEGACADCRLWLGADDIAHNGDWRWNAANGDPVDYSAWGFTEPNGGDGENCMEFSPDGKWNDWPCNGLRLFICEG